MKAKAFLLMHIYQNVSETENQEKRHFLLLNHHFISVPKAFRFDILTRV